MGSRPGGRHARPGRPKREGARGHLEVTPSRTPRLRFARPGRNRGRAITGDACRRCGAEMGGQSGTDSLIFFDASTRRPPSSDALTGRQLRDALMPTRPPRITTFHSGRIEGEHRLCWERTNTLGSRPPLALEDSRVEEARLVTRNVRERVREGSGSAATLGGARVGRCPLCLCPRPRVPSG